LSYALPIHIHIVAEQYVKGHTKHVSNSWLHEHWLIDEQNVTSTECDDWLIDEQKFINFMTLCTKMCKVWEICVNYNYSNFCIVTAVSAIFYTSSTSFWGSYVCRNILYILLQFIG